MCYCFICNLSLSYVNYIVIMALSSLHNSAKKKKGMNLLFIKNLFIFIIENLLNGWNSQTVTLHVSCVFSY